MKRHPLNLLGAAFCALGLLVLGASEAHCADVVKPAALYLSLSAADLGSTALAEANGATEANPWMRSHRVPKQLAVSAALTFADVRLQRTGHHKRLRVIVTAVRVVVVAINLHNARRER